MLSRLVDQPIVTVGTPEAVRPIDRLSELAGVDSTGLPVRLRNGGFTVMGPGWVLRGGRGDLPSGYRLQADPEVRELAVVPRTRVSGTWGSWWYHLEDRSPGRQHTFLTGARRIALAEFLAQLPEATQVDLRVQVDETAGRYPQVAEVVLRAGGFLNSADLAAGVCHGDLWLGNCLWDGPALVGVVDWDRSVQCGIRGVDLFYAQWMHERLATRRSVSNVLARRYWTRWVGRGGPLHDPWRHMGLPTDDRTLAATTVAWWLSVLAANASSPSASWLRANVTEAAVLVDTLIEEFR